MRLWDALPITIDPFLFSFPQTLKSCFRTSVPVAFLSQLAALLVVPALAAPDLPACRIQPQMASLSRSPVRILTASSMGMMKIFPSPMVPVRAVRSMISTT